MAPRSSVRRSLRRTVVDMPPDPRRGEESSRGTVRRGRDAGGGGGRGRGRGETLAEFESDSAGDAPARGASSRGAVPRELDSDHRSDLVYPFGVFILGGRIRCFCEDYEEFLHCGFASILSSDMHPHPLPHIACCMEFIASFNHSTSVGVLRGRRIRIDDDLVRTVFDVHAETRTISSCIRSSKLQDWMPIRNEVGKRYMTRFCAIEGWDVMLQVIQMVFFASRRPRTVSGRFLRYLQGRFPGCETPWDDTRLARYNISGLIAESIRRECSFIQTHFQRTRERAPEKRRFAETFIGIPLTLIFLRLELVTEAESEAGAVVPDGGFPLPGGDDSSSEDGDSTYRETVDRDILMDELTILRQQSVSLHAETASLRKMGLRQPLISPGESRIKTLVLDIFGLFVCVCRTHSDREVAASMGYTVHRLIHPQMSALLYYVVRDDLNLVLDTLMSVAEVIIWTLTIWGIDECDRVRPSRLERGKLTPMKDFRRFYDMCVCTRDVLLVDVEVARNSPNHPFSAVHPWPFGLGLGTHLAYHHAYVMDRLVPWLTEWSVDSSPTPDFVQSQRTRIDGADPIEGLCRFWGQQPSETDRIDLLAGALDVMLPVSRAEESVGPTVDPLVDSGAEGLVRPLADPLPEPLVDSGAEGSVGAIADPLLEPLVVNGTEGSVGAVADPLLEALVDSGAEGSVGPVADRNPEPVLDTGAEGSVGPVADPLLEPVVDTGAEGSIGPILDPSALQIAQTVAELDAEGSAAPPSDD
ncbi:hypothetical protein R1sor_012773 [Riccia sorocarpa]|uniref:Uncharacterized protein n=1 Tax=Riccia sorocarpa TaxID=122646 RepID=A0ABD3I8Q3_9MARC